MYWDDYSTVVKRLSNSVLDIQKSGNTFIIKGPAQETVKVAAELTKHWRHVWKILHHISIKDEVRLPGVQDGTKEEIRSVVRDRGGNSL